MINQNNRKWWTLGTVCFALFMILLDGNVVNLAIPKIMQGFGASLSQVEWINNAYLLSFAILLITLGRLGDAFGRKRMFLGGLVVFTLGSILCGSAGSVDWLVAFRIIQAVGGAAMMPATLSLISANFAKEERGTAMGIWGAVSGLAIVLGPIIGGYLTDSGLGEYLNGLLHINEFWRYVFYINIPVGVVAFIFGLMVINESKDHEKNHNFDIFGTILSALSLFLLTYGLIESSKFGWFWAKTDFMLGNLKIAIGNIGAIPIIFILSALLMALFVWHESRVKNDPLMDLRLFRSRNFSVGNLSGSILNFSMMGSFFLLPLFLQTILGYTAIKTGQVLVPLALTIMFSAPMAGKLSDKYGAKYIVTAGMLLMSLGGFYVANFRLDTTTADLILPFIVMGLGMGLSLSPLTNITLYDAPEDEIGGASGVFSTTRQIGSVMGIAILGAVLQTSMLAKTEENINNLNSLSQASKAVVVDTIKSEDFSFSDQRSQDILSDKLKDQIISENKALSAAESIAPSPQQLTDPAYMALAAKKQSEAQEAMIEKMKQLGKNVAIAGKQGFVDSVNHTFNVAAVIALFGAIISLAFRNNRVIK